MKTETLKYLCDPETHNPLTLEARSDGTSVLYDKLTGRQYPINDGIPDFLVDRPPTGMNKKYQTQYDMLSPFYNFVTKAAIRMMRASEADVRREYLCELEIERDSKVLEVSVGTGSNLRLLPADAQYYGLDISSGQIKQCSKIIKKIGLQVDLFLGDAEQLPFRDSQFDVVFHMGGINYFSNPQLALTEMIRVAKPGTKIVVVDETDRFTKQLARIPVVREFFKHHNGMATPELVAPSNVDEVEVRELFGGRLWYLSFRKPLVKVKPMATVTNILERRILQRNL